MEGHALQKLLATPAAALAPAVSGNLSVGPCQQRKEGDPGNWALKNLHTTRPGLHLERPLQLRCISVDTTRGTTITGYELRFNWRRAGRQG